MFAAIEAINSISAGRPRRARRLTQVHGAATLNTSPRTAVQGAILAGSLAFLAAAPVRAQDTSGLIVHRAVYDLSLSRTRGNSQIAGVRGRILYDFSGNACDGYSLVFRQFSELDNSEGKVSTSDLRSTTWEGGDAKSFKFSSQNFVDDNLVDAVDGNAQHSPRKTAVDLRKPARRNLDFEPNVVFPTEHMVRAITAARSGKTVLSFPVYDGSESGDKVFNTLTVIGHEIASDHSPPDDAAAHVPQLAKVPRWPVSISYFSANKASESAEQTPDYTISFELYANGISRALSLDYNDFVVSGKLTSLELKKPKPCK